MASQVSPSAGSSRVLAARLMIALLFVLSGFGKLMAPAGTVAYIASAGLPLPQLGVAIAILVELGGGLALALGFRTRIVASVLALFTIVAAAIFHHDFADQNQMIHFFKDIAITGGLLAVCEAGAGRLSFDNRQHG